MRICPILIDSRPAYLQGSMLPTSLLLSPHGASTVLERLQARLAHRSDDLITVVTTFEPDGRYEAALRRISPNVGDILPPDLLFPRLQAYQPSDRLLIVDARSFLGNARGLDALIEDDAAEPRWARHLVALESMGTGTEECVQLDEHGRVRRIQRFYDRVTWPFTSGVAASLLPIACALLAPDLPLTALADLRRSLARRGVPNLDVPLREGMFDLGTEAGLLALNERAVLALARRQTRRGRSDRGLPVHCGDGVQIHPGARLVGPVVLLDAAVIDEGATIIGPAIVGADCRVGRNAVVAQCVLGPGTIVSPATTIRHRALFGPLPSGDPGRVREGDGWIHAPFPGVSPRQPQASVEIRDPPRRWSVYPRLKRAVEPMLAATALVLLSPLLALVALLIRIDSRGPVLFTDRRETKGGRAFRCYKFRTMLVGAHTQQRKLLARNEMDGPQFKLDADPRVTRVGRWLRVCSLDELPQLINIMKGEMSFVGPRPSPFHENQVCVPWREGRLSVRPGITGLWQVCRHDRAHGDFHQWIYYDLLYVRHVSFWLDIKIVLATIVTLGGKGHVPLSWLIPARKLDRQAA